MLYVWVSIIFFRFWSSQNFWIFQNVSIKNSVLRLGMCEHFFFKFWSFQNFWIFQNVPIKSCATNLPSLEQLFSSHQQLNFHIKKQQLVKVSTKIYTFYTGSPSFTQFHFTHFSLYVSFWKFSIHMVNKFLTLCGIIVYNETFYNF